MSFQAWLKHEAASLRCASASSSRSRPCIDETEGEWESGIPLGYSDPPLKHWTTVPDSTPAIDPDLQRLLAIIHDVTQPRITGLTPAEARAWATSMRRPSRQPREIELVVDRTLPGPDGPLPVRVYHPVPSEPRPLLVHFHGGGWVLGSVEDADPTARRLACDADAVVVSIDYRLAPEHPFPAAVDDAVAATRWLQAHADEVGGDASRVLVGGDSAGGNLAAVTTLALRDSGDQPLAGQYLLYPVTDADFTRDSMIRHATGKLLETADMGWFWDHYCPEPEARRHWRSSPLRADSMKDLPPAIVALAGHDPLFDEGRDYADRLVADGVPVTCRIAEDLVHGYFGLGDASARCDEEIAEVSMLIRDLAHGAST